MPVSSSFASFRPGVSRSDSTSTCTLRTQQSSALAISSVVSGPLFFFVFRFLARALCLNLRTHAVTRRVSRSSRSTSQIGHPTSSSGSRFTVNSASATVGLDSSLTLFVVTSSGCVGHSLSSSSQSGPENQFPFSILSKFAPRLPRSAKFLSVGQCFQIILVSGCSLPYLRPYAH